MAEKKKREIDGTKILESREIEKRENQRFNFYIIREMWKRFNTEPKEELFRQMGISESAFNRALYEEGYIDFNKESRKERCSIKNNGLRDYLLGRKIIKIGITMDDWRDHMDKSSKENADKKNDTADKNKAKQIKFEKLSGILDDVYMVIIYLPEIMKPKDDIGRLYYFCKYGRECDEQDLELKVLKDVLNGVTLASIYKCKDKRLLESILSMSKERLRDIETVDRCLELLERMNINVE